MANDTVVTRREVLRGAAAAAAAVAAPSILGGSVLAARGRRGANDRINVVSIGVRNMGGGHLKALLGAKDVQVVGVCDVDRGIRQAAVAQAELAYAQRKRDGTFAGVLGYNDFREVLARSDVDAVVIAVPDQWHAAISIAAVRAGKDVYCEKPMTLTIDEGKAMIQAVRRYGRILQVGSQRRSSARHRHVCELVRNGRIGKLIRVEAGVPVRPAKAVPWQPQDVPPDLDYEMWLGPAPWAPYTAARCHYNFRFIRDYSGGEMTNFGAHYFDVAQWGIGADGSGPVEVQGRGEYHRTGLYDTFFRVSVEYTYADGVKLVVNNQETTRFIGTDGWIDAEKYTAQPAGVLRSVIGDNEIRLYRSEGGHMDNFLDCVRTRMPPAAPVEVGHRSCTVCHLGNIAMTLQRKLTWDPVAERFPGDDEANRMLHRPYREPWSL